MRINWTLIAGYIIILAAIYFLHQYSGPSHNFGYLGIGLIVLLFLWRAIFNAFMRMYLRKNGVAATASLISSHSTGTYTNKIPVMRLQLQVYGLDGTTWEAGVTKRIYPEDMYKLQPGTKFDVLYDPKNKSNVVLT